VREGADPETRPITFESNRTTTAIENKGRLGAVGGQRRGQTLTRLPFAMAEKRKNARNNLRGRAQRGPPLGPDRGENQWGRFCTSITPDAAQKATRLRTGGGSDCRGAEPVPPIDHAITPNERDPRSVGSRRRGFSGGVRSQGWCMDPRLRGRASEVPRGG